MGNSAIRGCTTVSTSVRLLQADGKVLEFPDPVLAIRVMQDYPGHTVVRYNASAGTRPSSSSSAAGSSGHHVGHRELHPLEEAALGHGCKFPIASQPQPIRKVAILRADEELQPGNTYYLLPVPRHQPTSARPSSKKQTLKFPKSSSKVGSSYEYEPERRSEKKSNKVLRRSTSMPHPREMQQQHTQQACAQQAVNVAAVSCTAPAAMPRQSLGRLLMEGRSSSLGSNGASSSSQQQNSLQLQMQETFDMLECRRWKRLPQTPRTTRTRRSLQIGWKPVLESIPECRPPEFRPRAFLSSYIPDRSRSTPILISQAVH